LKGVLGTTATITGYTLFKFLGANIFQPVEQGSMSVAGTHSGANALGWGMTTTFRDTLYKKARFEVLESVYEGLLKLPYPTGDAAVDALIADFLPASVATNSIYEFHKTRAGVQIASVHSFTNAPNRRVRRKRGLA
jgi:hypothetical protein